ncbi:hypothetical protein NE235_10760 [Actinoallomurus spadix]|uniref:Uncharacterized protein n=1 Tax=Actinoallomurus spadix TaxID=79912 RepID=A0ABP3GL56_9ACTN|nr:hypothetical protein [Actinoallomurus spadix]MCO5986583.1 hypothetical protein [Actinoallomurus spadix]
MTRNEALRGGAAFTIPAALVIGASLGTLALTGIHHGGYGGEIAQPPPAPTVTVTSTPVEKAPAPSSRPSRTARAREVVEAAPAGRPVASTGHRTAAVGERRSGDRSSPSSSVPRPAPGPSTNPPAQQPPRGGLSATVRLPLGVLPSVGITIGGSK